ncbi:class Ib ribonucleoside-diphosphate reductase assembly flavoprotein NrdI [Bifidobacterium thermophilum]|uniref:Protein NrdI n=1 Tax=Bifidobacterium thermophilum RBL67 TaxID=1254439 RepID=M4RAE7_9BIFI|nr:class Ib ribonucleoside-diphosphate reductase assembly flavoprotein NrdI [Bifidobacterium thermophilum]AGH40446.1 ribonucleotide reductase stimulatory protein [Bifidobacterium thermophilum RBL67]MDW8485902.1 class Ib ribonucleoside-diphosphate reductase assembly flavoprotein NrdI [Bifidobacterium thermophilum]
MTATPAILGTTPGSTAITRQSRIASPRTPASADQTQQTQHEQTQPTQPASTPESNAIGTHIGAVVYFSSASENTARFIAHCRLPDVGINVYRIPLRPKDAPLVVNEPFVIVVPTYGGGDVSKALPPQVRRFLNDRGNRSQLRGVIASGNTNFGDAFCAAGDVIAAKCHVPFLYSFELTGTPEDMRKVREGLRGFFSRLASSKPAGTD